MGFASKVTPSAENDAKALAMWTEKNDPLDIVLPLSIAAGWAYAPPDSFQQVMVRRGLSTEKQPPKLVEVVNDAMFVCAKAYVTKVGTGAIIAFRGTEPTNIINWLADGQTGKVAFHANGDDAPNGKVHDGFYRNLRAVFPLVLEQLDALKPEWLYITGHSYGGAIAVLAGALLADYEEQKKAGFDGWFNKLKGVFTFGQPLVGDAKFAEKYGGRLKGRLVRFIYETDVVPHVPPRFDGWVHFGQEYWAPDGTQWKKEQSLLDKLRGLAAEVRAPVEMVSQNLLVPRVIRDHAPNNYIRVSLPAQEESGSEFD
jgi:hypothetical protein